MKKITKLATRLRVVLTLCALFSGFHLANAAEITIVPNEDLELGSEVMLSEKFTAPTTQNTTTYTAVEITPSVSGTLYVNQVYKASQQSTCNLLYNSTVITTGVYSGDFIVEGTSLSNAYTYQTWEYELNADETYYYFSYLGLKNNSVSAANAIEFQFLWMPENGDWLIPLDTEYEVKEGEFYILTTPENGKFLTLTSNVELPSATNSSGSITNSTFIFRDFGNMLGMGNGQGENIAGSSVEDGEYQYLFSQTQNRSFFIKASEDATVKFEAVEVLSPAVTSITPAPGETISDSYWEGEVELAFNPSVGYVVNGNNSVSVTYTPGGSEEEITVLLTPERKNRNWAFNFLEYYLAAEPGTDIKIAMKDLQYFGFIISENLTGNDNVTIDNGVVNFSYPKPVFAAEPYNWPLIYAYYAPNTAAGIITLTFSETITGADSYASLTFGDPEDENAPVVNIPVTYKNNTLTFNFTDIDFERVTGVDLSGFEYSTITLSLSGLTSLSGQEYNGDGIFTQSLNFSDTYYGNVAPQRYMTQEATIISPAVGTYLPALYEFVIAWGQDNPVSLVDGSVLATLQINDNDPVYVACEIDLEGYLTIDVSQYSIVENENVYGIYTITLPEGLVVNDKNLMNEAQAVAYEFIGETTGILNLGEDLDLNAPVYNLQGIRMNVKNASELPKGIYIINGKKIIK